MKIVILNDDFPPKTRNSVSEIAAMHAEEFEKAGHDVWVITTHRTEENSAIIREKNIISIPRSYRKSLRYFASLRNGTMNAALQKELESLQPDVVHAHNIHAYLTYDALRIAAMFTSNVHITMHDVMSFSFGRLTTDSYFNSKGTNTRLTVPQQIAQVGLQWNPFKNPFVKSRLGYCKNIIAVSHALETALNQNDIENTTVIHHGIDANTNNPSTQSIEQWKEKFGLDGKRTILFGGRLRLDKGIAELLSALEIVMHEHKAARLIIAGESDRWEQVITHLNPSKEVLSKCICTGWLNAVDLHTAFHAADIVTTPSMCLDTFNLMNLHAMLAKKPVVGTIFGGTPEIVVDGETGYVCDPRDTNLFAERLTELVQDSAKAQQMGVAGFARATKEFSKQISLQRYLDLFQASAQGE